MVTAFEEFVNTELPKRIGTNEHPATMVAGRIPVYTGVGLLTEAQEVEDIVPSEVLWYPDLASFPVEGELEKLYVAEDTDTVYRWKGLAYAIVGSTLVLGETSTTAYRGDRGKTAYDHSQATGNPHGTAIADISGLQGALDGKEPAIAGGTSSQYIRGNKSLATLSTDAVPETANRVYLSPAQKTVATQAATAALNGYLSSADWSTFNGKQAALVSGTNIKSVNGNSLLGNGDLTVGTPVEAKSASFTAEIGKAYTLGTPTATLDIQFPTGTTTGQQIVTYINRAALTYDVTAKAAAGQQVGYTGAGSSYPLSSGLNDHILHWEYNGSNSTWELKQIVPASSIADIIAFCSSVNILSRLKLNLPTATGTYNWYTPAKNINFGDLPSVATNDNNSISLAALRCRILGGQGNTVSGTGNVLINCTNVTTSSLLGQNIQASSGSTIGIDWATRFIGNGTVRGTTATDMELATVVTQLKALNIFDAGSVVLTTDNAAAAASNTPKAAVANPYDDAATGVATHELELQVATRFSTSLFQYIGATHAKYLISVVGTTATATLVSSCSAGTVATFTVTPSVSSGRLYITVANTTGSDKPIRVRGILKSLYSYI